MKPALLIVEAQPSFAAGRQRAAFRTGIPVSALRDRNSSLV